MEELLVSYGYLGLFLLSFLAATLVPVGSEWLLVVLLLQGFDPALSVSLAALGNTLGALTTYAIGLWGGPFLIGRLLRIDDATRGRAERFYARYGRWSLLLSWLPVVGDPLCLVAGVLRVGLVPFALLVGSSKLARYLTVALLVWTGNSAVS